MINYLLPLGWLFAAFILGAAALYAFKRRRAEIAESIGENRPLNFIVTLVTGFTGFAIALYSLWGMNIKFGLFGKFIISALIFTVIYLIIEFILRRRLKHIWHGIIKLPVHLGIIFAVVIIFATGLFGYSSRVPAVSDIKSVEMSYTGSPFNVDNVTGYAGNADSYYVEESYKYTTETDFNIITTLHKELINAGKGNFSYDSAYKKTDDIVVPYDIFVKYTLKDGSIMTRYYDRTTAGVLKDMLMLDNTKAIKTAISNSLSGNNPDNSNANTLRNIYLHGEIVISDSLYASPNNLQLSDEQRQLLLKAINSDMEKQSIEERYLPNKPPLAILQFKVPNFSRTYQNYSTSYYYGSSIIYVTEQFTDTLAFLKSNGLLESYNVSQNIESIVLYKYKFLNYYGNSDKNLNVNHVQPKSLYFMSFIVNIDKPSFSTYYQITNQSQLDTVNPLLRSNYFASGGGYVAIVKLKGSSTYVYKFLPAADAPQFVRDSVK